MGVVAGGPVHALESALACVARQKLIKLLSPSARLFVLSCPVCLSKVLCLSILLKTRPGQSTYLFISKASLILSWFVPDADAISIILSSLSSSSSSTTTTTASSSSSLLLLPLLLLLSSSSPSYQSATQNQALSSPVKPCQAESASHSASQSKSHREECRLPQIRPLVFLSRGSLKQGPIQIRDGKGRAPHELNCRIWKTDRK